MSTVRARFDGKVFVPERPVQLPVGEVVEIQFSDESRPERGSAAALLQVLKSLPKSPPEDVAEMERLIKEGMSRTKYEGVFDDLRDRGDANTNGN